MPNIRGGKGYKKSKSGRVRDRPEKKIEVVDVTAGEGFFAKVKKKLGGKPAQIEVTLSNGTTNIVYVRGKMHKKVWINAGMIVLVNKDMEIIKVIKDSDKDIAQATDMLDKVNTGNVSYIDIYGSSSDDDSDDDSHSNSINDDDKLQKKLEITHSDSEDSLVNPNRNYEEEEDEDKNEDEDEDEEDGEDKENYVQEEYYNNYKDNHYNKKNENKNKKSKFNIDDI